ncbi:uncharacterized protein LOC132123265 [Carassius carassius]|uniref:uncharacterized protein LOC132123265 n=1 Tax=Carassius carassius TaxID=217509 RepID=UPI0028686E63|nr:uncharacterized protein LOC132123265 [Carassius carassius]
MERDELREWRALRESQDKKYLPRLRADQDRDQAQRREADLEKRRKEALERRRLNLSRLAEPQDGIPLQLKYPDGHIIRRRFYLTHPIQHLFDFVGSDEMATEVFFIQRAMAPRIRSTIMGRIMDYINESCTVFVTWDDVIDITDIDHTLVPEENMHENNSSGYLDRTVGSPDFTHVNDTNGTNEPDLKTLLATLVSNVCIEETPSSNMINICRQNVMNGAVQAFARRTFTPEAKLSVVFMDDFNQAEGAVDEGGPKREFFKLLMVALKERSLFTGPQNNKNLSLDSRG